jgi:SNF2 family DNA or RNA helicase
LPQLLKNRLKQSHLYEQLDGLQQDAVRFTLTKNGCALFCEQRTGKTWITLTVIEILDPENVLLVVPLSNLESTWVKHLNKYLPQYEICLSWPEYKAAISSRKILLINYEKLPSFIKKAQKSDWDIAVWDESQKIKARGTLNSRMARRFRNVKRRMILTGTPMDGNPIHIWGQFRFVDHTILGEKWTTFAQRFCLKGGFMGKQWFFNEDMRDEFIETIKPYSYRITKEDIGIPDPIIHVDKIEMFGPQRRLYDKLERTMIAHVEGQRVKTDLKITRNAKLEQIVNGWIYTDDGVYRVGNAKARKLKWRIQRVKLPVVIFCAFLEDIDIIYETIKPYVNRIGILYGQVKDTKKHKARTEIQQMFQNGEFDALICQIRTGGVGIDLYKADTAIFYSMRHSWIDYDQARSRIEHRSKEYPAELFLLIVQSSIDEDKREAVMSKRSLNEVVMERLQKGGSYG